MSNLRIILGLFIVFLISVIGLSEAATLSVSPSRQTIGVGQEANVEIAVKDAVGLTGFQFDLTYNSNILELKGASLSQGISATQLGPTYIDLANAEKSIRIGAYIIGGAIFSDNQPHFLVNLKFKAKNGGTSNLTFSKGTLVGKDAVKMSTSYENGSITVTVPIRAPSNLFATATSGSQINLKWKDNSNNEKGFKIERKTGIKGTWSQIAIVRVNKTTYTNTGLTAGTTYYYRVRAYNANGNSAFSNEASATTLSIPATPSNLTATVVSRSQINLRWKDNSNNEKGFKIERKTGIKGRWSQIATAGANATTYNNTGLTRNTTYYYRVRAYNSVGASAYSNEASATTKR